MPKEAKATRIHPETAKIRGYLERLSTDKLADTTLSTYTVTTSHKPKPFSFNNEKRRLMNLRGGEARVRAREAKRESKVVKSEKKSINGNGFHAPVPARAHTRVRILATLPLSAYENVDSKVLKGFASELLKQVYGGTVGILLLADPVALEIRETA